MSTPFVLRAKNNANQECFKGNNYGVLDISTNCTRYLLNAPLNDHEPVFLNDDHDLCINHGNWTRDWVFEDCRQPDDHRMNYVQIKHDDFNTYMYCFEHILGFSDQNLTECKNVVYIRFQEQNHSKLDYINCCYNIVVKKEEEEKQKKIDRF